MGTITHFMLGFLVPRLQLIFFDYSIKQFASTANDSLVGQDDTGLHLYVCFDYRALVFSWAFGAYGLRTKPMFLVIMTA
jgi:hypothetical protein